MMRVPAKRWGDPMDLAGAVIFLASSASDYVTGCKYFLIIVVQRHSETSANVFVAGIIVDGKSFAGCLTASSYRLVVRFRC